MADNGGAIYSSYNSNLKLTNLTVLGNTATMGGTIYAINASSIELTNCILWDNSESNIYLDDCGLIVSYSDIEGGLEEITITGVSWVEWLEGNINEDPLCYQTGEYPFSLTDVSPCIDAGIPDTAGLYLPPFDILGSPRIWDQRIDMGAVEWNTLGVEEFGVWSSEFGVRSYPNPFSTSTTFEYELQYPSVVQITIYTQLGEQVEVIEKKQSSGNHQVVWNAERLPSGIYFCTLKTNFGILTRKIIKL